MNIFQTYTPSININSCEWSTACFQIWTQLRFFTPPPATLAYKTEPSLAQGSKKTIREEYFGHLTFPLQSRIVPLLEARRPSNR